MVGYGRADFSLRFGMTSSHVVLLNSSSVVGCGRATRSFLISSTRSTQRAAYPSRNAKTLRSFIAILGDQDVGIFVSAGGFTSDAEMEARTKETRKLTLINLRKLVDLWIENYEKIAESDRRLLPLKSIHFLAPNA